MSLVKMQEIAAVVAQVLGEPNLIVATLCDFFCWRYFDKVNKDYLEGLEQACNTLAPENWETGSTEMYSIIEHLRNL